MSIERIEAFEDFSLFAVPKTAVSQYPINIEHHQFDTCKAFPNGGRDFGEHECFGRVGNKRGSIHLDLDDFGRHQVVHMQRADQFALLVRHQHLGKFVAVHNHCRIDGERLGLDVSGIAGHAICHV